MEQPLQNHIMNVVSHITDEQKVQIPFYVEKWKAKCLLTSPIFRPAFEKGIQDICEEIKIEVPREFLYYSSPAAMWRDFEVWKPKITQVRSQYWGYQIPLCDPESMHRRWSPGNKRPAFNFAAKRYSPGIPYALCETENSDETSGTVIERGLHSYLWQQFEFYIPFLHWHLFDYYSGGQSGAPCEYLAERAYKEDPSSQVGYEDQCFIGPEVWLLRELACVDFCHHVLGITRNERLYRGLEAIAESGSFCGVFGQICVACERPSKIEINGQKFKVTFSDGDIFTYEEL